ncbi:hypothetical protein DGM93_00085 [Xanthomonas phaseoli pv. phaseoli]|nr:hypothetical protein DGM93_00085 [Xanthomonas phaseoli pv. phaseoli]QWN31371.1 hypothetical protein DGM81_00085 [Xanthomonas phaseoli pv. phaseoli]
MAVSCLWPGYTKSRTRPVLNSDRRELLNTGANVEIRYPYNRVGIVKEWGEKAIQGPASKGIEPRDFGKR